MVEENENILKKEYKVKKGLGKTYLSKVFEIKKI